MPEVWGDSVSRAGRVRRSHGPVMTGQRTWLLMQMKITLPERMQETENCFLIKAVCAFGRVRGRHVHMEAIP